MYMDYDSYFLLRSRVILSVDVVSNKTEVTFSVEDVCNTFNRNVVIHR